MKAEKLRDYAIVAAAIVFAVTTIYSTYQSVTFFSGFTPSSSQGSLSAYTSCDQSIDSGITIAEVTLDNFSEKEVKNIKCSVVDTGGLTLNSSNQEIASLMPQSSDVCYFELTGGDFVHPIKFEITHDSGSIKTICQPY